MKAALFAELSGSLRSAATTFSDYLAELRRERPRRPYFLGALCAGAYIVAVMARELQPYGPVYMRSSRQRIAGPDALSRLFTGPVARYEVGGRHAEALDPRNPVFADRLLHCVGAIQAASA